LQYMLIIVQNSIKIRVAYRPIYFYSHFRDYDGEIARKDGWANDCANQFI